MRRCSRFALAEEDKLAKKPKPAKAITPLNSNTEVQPLPAAVTQPTERRQPQRPKTAQPAQPVAQPAQPVAQPAQPVAQPAQPVAQPASVRMPISPITPAHIKTRR